MRKIAKLFVFLVSIVLIIYVLFPIWSDWLLRSNLPKNITIESYTSEYPGLQTIVITDLKIIVDGFNIFIDDIQLDYDLKKFSLNNIKINKLVVKQQASQAKINSYKLPLIELSDYDKYLDFTELKINFFSFQNENNDFQISQVDLLKIKSCEYKISGQFHLPLEPVIRILKLNTQLYCEKNNSRIAIKISDKNLADIEYEITNKNIALTATISSNELQSLLPAEYFNSPIKTTGDVQLHWLQERVGDNLQIRIINQVALTQNIFQPQPLLLPITLSLTSNLNKFPLSADINLTTQTQAGVTVNKQTTTVHLDSVNLILNSDIILDYADNNEPQLSINNTKIIATAKSLKITDTSVPLVVDLIDYQLTMNLSDLHSSVYSIIDSQWQLSGLLQSPELVTEYRKDKDNIRINSPVEMSFQISKNNQLSTDGELKLTDAKTQYQNSFLAGQLILGWKDVNQSLSAGNLTLSMDNTQSQVLELDIEQLSFNSDILLHKERITGKGVLKINQQLLTPYSFELDKKTSEIKVELEQNKLTHQLFNHYIAAIGEKHKIALNIGGGEITHSGDIALTENLFIDSQFAIKDLLFKFGENTIQGLNVEQKITSLEPLHLRSNLQIDSIQFSSGLALNKLSASISSDGNSTVEISSLVAELLAGKLKADSIIITPQGMNQSLLRLEHIALTELIFFMDIPGLYAEGDMEFLLPIAMLSDAMTINNGSFQSTNKGIIKYTTGQSELDGDENIALKALQNFHFDSLNGHISYDKDGQYRIKLHLLGSNPDLYDGYPVDFVLNLQGELSGVFRSLFLTGSFEQAVLEQLKSSELEQ